MQTPPKVHESFSRFAAASFIFQNMAYVSNVMTLLGKYIQGFDWLCLCNTSKALRPNRHWNRYMEITLTNYHLTKMGIPLGCTYLKIYWESGCIIPIFPETLRILYVAYSQGGLLKRWTFPEGLKVIVLGRQLFPLEHITLPKGLLKFSAAEVQLFEWKSSASIKCLPDTLCLLRLSGQQSAGCSISDIPRNVKKLQIYQISQRCLDSLCWPKSLRTLVLKEPGVVDLAKVPSGVETLEIQGQVMNVTNLPLVKRLKLNTYISGVDLSMLKIPETVTELVAVRQLCGLGAISLIPSLTRLTLRIEVTRHFQKQVSACSNLQYLNLSGIFSDRVTDWDLPGSLRVLLLGDNFQQPVVGWKLPDTLKELFFGDSFNQPVKGWVLPFGLEKLCFGRSFNQPVRDWVLPESLVILDLGNGAIDSDDVPDLPLSLKILRIRMGSGAFPAHKLPPGITSVHLGPNRDDAILFHQD